MSFVLYCLPYIQSYIGIIGEQKLSIHLGSSSGVKNIKYLSVIAGLLVESGTI